MQNLTQIASAASEAVKTKQSLLDAGAVATSFTLFGLTSAQWAAIGAGVLLAMRLFLTSIEIVHKLRGRQKGSPE